MSEDFDAVRFLNDALAESYGLKKIGERKYYCKDTFRCVWAIEDDDETFWWISAYIERVGGRSTMMEDEDHLTLKEALESFTETRKKRAFHRAETIDEEDDDEE